MRRGKRDLFFRARGGCEQRISHCWGEVAKISFWGRKNCSVLTSDSKAMSNLNVQEFLENLQSLARKEAGASLI